jgi:SAM-dependent methyltransferase
VTKDRERDFWDAHVGELEDYVREYHAGPDANTRAMLEALEPLHGKHVLDFACGAGVTSAWLSDRGAVVTGLDLSPKSIARASELADEVGAKATFVTAELQSLGATFDRIAGRFALHHVDCQKVAPLLAERLRPGGTAAFLETMNSNPTLRFARAHLLGRFGIPRIGTEDERPLGRDDLEVLAMAFGELRLAAAEITFLRIFDRQVLRYRNRRVSGILGGLDDLLLRVPGTRPLSYHQVLVLAKPRLG